MFSSGNRFVCFHCHLPTPAYFINKKIKTTIMQTAAQECLLLTSFLRPGHELWVPGELPAPLPLAVLWCPGSRRAGQHGAGSRHGTTGRSHAAGRPQAASCCRPAHAARPPLGVGRGHPTCPKASSGAASPRTCPSFAWRCPCGAGWAPAG